MKIQIKCRVSSLKISNAKSVGITICDELQVCNSVGAWGRELKPSRNNNRMNT